MKKRNLLFLLLFLAGCTQVENNQTSGEVLSVFPDNAVSVDLTDYLDDIRCVPLETNDSCLLGRFVDVKSAHGKLYVCSGKALFIFDNRGRLLSRLKRDGRGPFEYSSIDDFSIDEHQNILVVDAAKHQIITYDSLGRDLASAEVDCFPRALAVLNDTILVVAADYYKSDNLFHFYDRRTMRKIRSCMPLHEQKLNYLHIMDQHNFTRQAGELLYTEAANVDIYSLTPTSVESKYHFTTQRFPSEEFYNTSFGDVMEFMTEFRRKNHVSLGGNFSCGKDILFYSWLGNDARYCFHNRKTNQSYTIKSISLADREQLSENFAIIPLDEGLVAVIIQAPGLMGKSLCGTSFLGLQEGDNPVICIGKLK